MAGLHGSLSSGLPGSISPDFSIEDSPYKINHRKTFYSDKPVEVTGIVVKQNNLDVTDAFNTKDETLLEDSSKQSRKVYRKRIENA